MKIEDLSPQKNAKNKPKRVGRGTGSGHGKTSCKGHKGLKARAGGAKGGGFEGGQMPLIRRLPKRGFKNIFRKKYEIINLDRLSVFDEGVVVTPESLKEKGIIKNQENKIKILGDGELKKRLIIHANKFSNSALESIKSKGGEAVLLSEKK